MSLQEATVQGLEFNAIKPKTRLPRPRNLRALIVDDIAENRAVLGVCCEQFGIDHEAVASGREAVEAARSGRFDLVFMDILMPGMDGVAATRAIRALPGPIASVPIIAVTTASEPMDVVHYRSKGITDVVSKPVNVTRLMEAVSAAIAQSRRGRRSQLPELVRLSA